MNQPLRPTRFSSSLTLLCPSVTSSLKFANSSIAIAVPPPWNKLMPAPRQISDPSYEVTETPPLAISPQVFHSKLKTLQAFWQILYWIQHFFLSTSPSQHQTPSTWAACLSAYLTDSLDFALCLYFVLIESLWISWFPCLRFCGRCRSFQFTITIILVTICHHDHNIIVFFLDLIPSQGAVSWLGCCTTRLVWF